ncbi:MAG: ABC transporter permease, partial [Bacteroidota bacterium]
KQRILVVDKDHSPASANLIDKLSENQTLYVKEGEYETTNLLQLRLETKATAVVVIPYRFEEDILLGRKPEVNCYLNMSNTLKANLVRGAIQSCITAMNAGIQISTLEKKNIPASIAAQRFEAVHHNVFLEFNRSGNYLLFLWPGIIMGTLQQLLLIVTAIGFSQEVANKNFNKNGLLKHTRSASKLIFIKVFPFFFMSIWILGCDYLLSIYFGILPPVHPWALLTTALLFVLGACMMGTLFSIIFPLPLKTTQTLMTFASPALTLSGFTWPADKVPVVLSAIADIIPLKPFLRSMRLIWNDGASFEQVLPEIYHQLILIAFFGLLSFLILRKKINKEMKDEQIKTTLVIA